MVVRKITHTLLNGVGSVSTAIFLATREQGCMAAGRRAIPARVRIVTVVWQQHRLVVPSVDLHAQYTVLLV